MNFSLVCEILFLSKEIFVARFSTNPSLDPLTTVPVGGSSIDRSAEDIAPITMAVCKLSIKMIVDPLFIFNKQLYKFFSSLTSLTYNLSLILLITSVFISKGLANNDYITCSVFVG